MGNDECRLAIGDIISFDKSSPEQLEEIGFKGPDMMCDYYLVHKTGWKYYHIYTCETQPFCCSGRRDITINIETFHRFHELYPDNVSVHRIGEFKHQMVRKEYMEHCISDMQRMADECSRENGIYEYFSGRMLEMVSCLYRGEDRDPLLAKSILVV